MSVTSDQELQQRLHLIVRARWGVLGILTTVGVVAHLLIGTAPTYRTQSWFLVLIVVLYNLAFHYALTRTLTPRALDVLRHLQIVPDLLVFTTLIYYTGGIESPFFLFYFLQVLMAGFIMPAGGTYGVATLAVLLYGGLLVAEYTQIIPRAYHPLRSDMFETIYQDVPFLLAYFTIIVGWLYAAAFLADYLSGLRRASETESPFGKQVQRQLSELENVIASSIDSISTTDKHGLLTRWSPGSQRIMGFTAEEVLGQPISKHYVGGIEEARKVMSLLKEKGELRNYETWLWHKDGTKVPVSLSASLLKDKQGNIVGTLGVGKDITERKQAEEEIQRLYATERQARQVAEALRDAMATLVGSLELDQVLECILNEVQRVIPHDAANIALVEASTERSERGDRIRFVRWRGYERFGVDTRVPGVGFRIADTPNYKYMAETGQPRVIPDTAHDAEWIPVSGWEWLRGYIGAPIRVRDKLIGFLNLDSATPGFFNAEHARLLATFAQQVGVAIENARLYEEVKSTKNYLENLFASSPDSIATTDQHGILTLVSPGTEKLTGYKPEEQLGQPLWKYYVGGIEEARRVMNILREQGDVRGYETWFLHKDGRKVPVSLSATLLKDEQGNIVGTLGMLKDITERKKAEEEIRRRLIREERLNELAHAVGGEIELSTLIPRLLPLVVELTGADAGTVAILDPDREIITYPYHYNLPDTLVGVEVSTGTGLAWRTMQNRQPILLDDYREHPGTLGPWVEAGVRSVLTVPLLVGDQVVGSLGLFSLGEVRPFAPEAVAAAEAAGRLAAVAIQRARLFAAEREQRREAETLREAALALTTSLDRNEVVERILRELQQVVPYDSASVQLLKDDRLEIIGGRGFPNLPEIVGLSFHAEGNNPNHEVVRTRAPFIVEDGPAVYEDFRREPHAQAGIHSWLGVPMLVGERLIGMIALDKKEVGFYTGEHARLALAFATQAAIVIENARLFGEERRRAAQLAVVNEVGRHAASTLRLDQILHDVTVAIQTGFGYYNVTTFLVEGDYAVMQAIAGGFASVVSHPRRQPLSQSIVGWAITHDQTVLVNDIRRDPHFFPGFPAEAAKSRSELCVPIRVDGQVIGALDVNSVELNAFDQWDVMALEILADQVALAYKNALTYGRLGEEKERLELLYEIAAEVNRSLDLDEILAHAIERITARLSGKVGYVYLVEPGTDRLRLRALTGVEAPPADLNEVPDLHLGQGVLGWVAAHGQVAVVDDVTRDERWSYVDALDRNVRSVVSVPLLRGEEVLGALSVLHPTPGFFGDVHSRLLMAIAQQVAVAVANARLHGTVRQQAMLDSLTQAYNHGELIRRLHAAVAEATAQDRPASFIMLDIDYFKEYNDRYGHVTGDLILKAIVQAIRVNIKKDDVVGRWGGEEFGIVLPHTDTARAMVVAERIRHTLAMMSLRDDQGRDIPKPTVSQGIATHPTAAASADELIDRADAALYHAKARGRDQVQYTSG